jgi:hypothetical protein
MSASGNALRGNPGRAELHRAEPLLPLCASNFNGSECAYRFTSVHDGVTQRGGVGVFSGGPLRADQTVTL